MVVVLYFYNVAKTLWDDCFSGMVYRVIQFKKDIVQIAK